MREDERDSVTASLLPSFDLTVKSVSLRTKKNFDQLMKKKSLNLEFLERGVFLNFQLPRIGHTKCCQVAALLSEE